MSVRPGITMGVVLPMSKVDGSWIVWVCTGRGLHSGVEGLLLSLPGP